MNEIFLKNLHFRFANDSVEIAAVNGGHGVGVEPRKLGAEGEARVSSHSHSASLPSWVSSAAHRTPSPSG